MTKFDNATTDVFEQYNNGLRTSLVRLKVNSLTLNTVKFE